MSLSKKQTIFQITFLLIIIFTTILLVEIGLRIYHISHERKGYVWVPDYYLGHALAKNNKFTYKGDASHPEFKTQNQTNSFGMMGGREFKIKKEDGVFRIVLLGDSFSEAMQVEEEGRYATLLEKSLNRYMSAQGKRVEIINAGVRGYSPIVYYLYYKQELSKFNADLVIVQLFANDVFEDNSYKTKSVLDAQNLPVKINEYFVKNYVEGNINQAHVMKENSMQLWLHKFLKDKSKFYEYFYARMVRWHKKNPFNLAKKAEPQYSEGYQFFIVQNHDSPSVFGEPDFQNRAWNQTKEYLLALKDLVRKDKADFMMFYIPIEAQLDLDNYGENSKMYFGNRQIGRYFNDRLKELADEKLISYIDLYEAFEANKNKGLYLNWDGHLTKDGQRLVAVELSNFIIKEELLGSSYVVARTLSLH